MYNELETERLALRLLEPGDAEAIERLAGDKEVADTTLNMPHPYPKGSAIGFIQTRTEAAARGDGYSFAVTLAEDGAFIGVVGLRINKTHTFILVYGYYWLHMLFFGKGGKIVS